MGGGEGKATEGRRRKRRGEEEEGEEGAGGEGKEGKGVKQWSEEQAKCRAKAVVPLLPQTVKH